MNNGHQTDHTAQARLIASFQWLLLTVVLLAFGLWNLAGPPMWWDEGWTLSVARHWVELDHYGRLRDGELARGGLEASFTVTVPVGLGMKLFGVGLWQGRLFGVFCAVGVILLLAALADRLFDRQVAWATVFAALLLTMHPQIHPLLQGRQVLAEMPMLLYLLASYLALWWALRGHWLALLPAMLGLGLAWISKGQTAPFLLASLGTTLVAALLWRQWRIAGMVGLAILGGYGTTRLLGLLSGWLPVDPALPLDPVEGLLDVIALVTGSRNRFYALQQLLSFGIPTLLALGWGLWNVWHRRNLALSSDDDVQPDHRGEARPATLTRCNQANWYIQLALLAFIGSWLGWFLLFSVGVPRYMAPPIVVGSIFVGALLGDLTGGFALSASLKRLTDLLTLRQINRLGMGALLALLIVTTGLSLTSLAFVRYYGEEDQAAFRVAALLNAEPPGTRIETYESELHFLLNQPYTFPPDQLHVELNRRSLLGEEVVIDYDPLKNDPDYLVVGRFARENRLYEPVIERGAFRLILEDSRYEVFERIRP
ncbi:glycosyltransferase family 39 protein [Candidatus Chloroploca sp. M-50]|uniref:Glycosyltransferase family 39 protein n=1 Tax=Candidatus Chloroploca mongolica TaxID=2528176 RepID=A0ABS4DCX8_9CHLR|nr:glycosyltransferase family 39 protein [Candidatus Chloroploca mongolica]MBP1467301.1 glycosyltransferase family 39 protein [Candidatus Chloroploca mongolica]